MLIRLTDANGVEMLVNTDHIITASPTAVSPRLTYLVLANTDDTLLVQEDIDYILSKQ